MELYRPTLPVTCFISQPWRPMTTYLLRRILWMIPVLLLVALITFVMMHQAPGGPWDRDLSRRQVDAATQEACSTRNSVWTSRSLSTSKAATRSTASSSPMSGQCHSRRPRPVLSPTRPRRAGYSVRATQGQTVLGQPFWLFDAAGCAGADVGGARWHSVGPFWPRSSATHFRLLSPLCVHDWYLSAQFCAGDLSDHLSLAGQLGIMKIIQRDWSSPAHGRCRRLSSALALLPTSPA
jgi:hypothetical protein